MLIFVVGTRSKEVMDCSIVGYHPPHAKLVRSHAFPLKKPLPTASSTASPPLCYKDQIFKSARSSLFQQYADADDQLHPLCSSHTKCLSSASQHSHLLRCNYNPSPATSETKFSVMKLEISMLMSSENGRPSVLPSSSSSTSTSTSTRPSSSPSTSSPTMTAMAKTLLVSEEQEAALSHLLSSKSLIEFITRVPSWADTQKESGMPQRQQRAFYSHQDWLQHRSSLRHMRHMLSSGSSRVIISLIPPVFTVTAISVVIAAYNTAINLSLLPPFFPLLHAASLPYELTAPAIALLLVFRTDASYSRYDEARKTWNKVMSTTQDFVRLSLQLIQNPQDMDLQFSLLAYIMAFPVSLKDESISQFIASINICERLMRTPIPLSYTRLTSRFLVLWHLTLPIILWDSCDWLVVPATFFNAATLFCIEEVGVIIEEPFPMLALDKMVGLAHENIREMLKSHQTTKEHICKLRTKDKIAPFRKG